jgi:hypothetical protein
MTTTESRAYDRQPPLARAIGGLLAVATATFVVASLLHFGVRLALGPLNLADPFAGAAIPEAIIALALGVGAIFVLARLPARWGVALATTLFALLATGFGLTITLGSGRTGDVAYHLSIFAVLAVTAVLLLLPAARRDLA